MQEAHGNSGYMHTFHVLRVVISQANFFSSLKQGKYVLEMCFLGSSMTGILSCYKQINES